MRKYIRKMLKYSAERKGVKISRYVKNRFEEMQIKKHGANRRNINKAKGTHPRQTWKARCSGSVFNNSSVKERKLERYV